MHGFADENVSGSGKDARGVLENLAGEALVNQFAELNVVIGENASGREKRKQH